MADSLNAATKYVATHRPDSLGWGPVEDLGPDILDGIRRVKSTDGADLIVWGSSTLTPVLLSAWGWPTRYLLLVYPILLGTRQTVLCGGNPRRASLPLRQHEGCGYGRRHDHVSTRRTLAHRVLCRAARLSRRQGCVSRLKLISFAPNSQKKPDLNGRAPDP